MRLAKNILSFISQFRIPTLLGLTIVLLGTGAGVVLVLQQQTITSKASSDNTPQNITFSNVEDENITISWQTSTPTTMFLSYGQNAFDKTTLDDADSSSPSSHLTHNFTLHNLTPQTTYQFKIISGRYTYPQILQFTTTAAYSSQNGFKPVIGSVLAGDQPLSEGLVYLNISGATTQSALIRNLGNFVIPLSRMQKQDLTGLFQPEEGAMAKLTVISAQGQASALIKLTNSTQPVGILKIGQNIDLTTPPPATTSASELNKFDLNNDKQINSSDYSVVLGNFGKPKNKKADLNGDGVVDKKDLDLILNKITSNKTTN